ncbi:hypothetical protein [Tateyamaria pelophila]|uniref:hypothetical protein n=1 Tax=Tateyamaria pelophila TaxID=328415 RepID=UPI001CBFC69B|nr:hypothetical protein [Tateyamaria pelophila]
MTTAISLSEFSQAVDRPESLIRMLAKSWDIPVDGESLSIMSVVRLIRVCESQRGGGMEEAELCRNALAHAKERELELHIAIEILQRERSSLKERLEESRDFYNRAETRADRLEAKLHEMSQSLAHLVDQRDRILANSIMRSRVSEKIKNGRLVLVLSDPVT